MLTSVAVFTMLQSYSYDNTKRNLVMGGKTVNRQWQMNFCASWLVVFLGTDVYHWMFKTKSAWFKIRRFPFKRNWKSWSRIETMKLITMVNYYYNEWVEYCAFSTYQLNGKSCYADTAFNTQLSEVCAQMLLIEHSTGAPDYGLPGGLRWLYNTEELLYVPDSKHIS